MFFFQDDKKKESGLLHIPCCPQNHSAITSISLTTVTCPNLTLSLDLGVWYSNFTASLTVAGFRALTVLGFLQAVIRGVPGLILNRIIACLDNFFKSYMLSSG